MKYLFILALLVVAGLAVSSGLARSERAECVRWESQQNEIANWYSTDWQKAQCKQFFIFFTK